MLQIFGQLPTPPVANYQTFTQGGLANFISRLIQLIIVIAGLWVLFNLVFGGFQYVTAGGDPGKTQAAWARIWQSFLGLVIVASAILLTSIVSWVIFGNPGYILNITILTPP